MKSTYLATQIGSQLTDVLYIDRPSIGLHQRDNQSNTVTKRVKGWKFSIVVEHDKDMITEADYVIDLA